MGCKSYCSLNPELALCCGVLLPRQNSQGLHLGQHLLCFTVRAQVTSTRSRQGLGLQSWVCSFPAGLCWQLLAPGPSSSSLWDLCLPGIAAQLGGASLQGLSPLPHPSCLTETANFLDLAQEAPYRNGTRVGAHVPLSPKEV